MKRLFIPLLFIVGLLATQLPAVPYLMTATNYAAGFFAVVGDENGQPLASGSLVQLIWDSGQDGKDAPSVQPGSIGSPTDDDVLIGTCQVGVSGGAPSAGTFVLAGTAPSGGGLCYLRAFHAVTPQLGTFYSESSSEFAIPPMSDPLLDGVEFPSSMNLVLGITPPLDVNMTPINPPIIIPANGGSFTYSIQIHNTTTSPVTFDVWIDMILPNGSLYGPVMVRTNLIIPGGATLTRQLTQAIPGQGPAGVYSYESHVGNHQTGIVIDEDAFPFSKAGASGNGNFLDDMTGWQTTGWEDGDLTTVVVPDIFSLSPPYPNPFNPTTQIRFGLPQTDHVRIDIYNILGSRVTTLVDEDITAGFHAVSWEARNIASGLYLVQMKSGGFVYTEKAYLLK
ncbi:MAG: T9SS type A sorting domain-containing protein [bacterium]|nr:T9SS type A sorting domain-containing protein [bacterium]